MAINIVLTQLVYDSVKWLAGQIVSGAANQIRNTYIEEPIANVLRDIAKGGKKQSVEKVIRLTEKKLLDEYGKDRTAKQVLDVLIRSNSRSTTEFWRTASELYLTINNAEFDTQELARLYGQVVGIPALMKGEAPPIDVVMRILEKYFSIFRENLLRQPDLDGLRAYEMLLQDRERNFILKQILERLTPPPPNLSSLYIQYSSFLQSEYSLLDFRGILHLRDIITLPLDEIYVPVALSRGLNQFDSPVSENKDSVEIEQSLKYIDLQEGKVSFVEIVSNLSRIVILGDPGAGKSTLVKHLTLHLINGTAESHLGINGNWLPIPFPISAYAEALRRNPDLSLFDYLQAYFSSRSVPGMAPLFEWFLRNGNAFIFFDGLDEILDKYERQYVISRIEDFVNAFGQNRFMVTSRIGGYQALQLATNFHHAILLPLNKKGIDLFIKQWSLALEKRLNRDQTVVEKKSSQRAEDLVRSIFKDEKIIDLATNPLLLTILSLIHYQGTRFPERRAELYKICINALAENWNAVRSLSGRPISLYLGHDRVDERFVIRMLGPMALWLHDTQPGGLLSTSDLEDQLSEQFKHEGVPFVQASALAEDFIQLIREGTGILQERIPDLYSFSHFSFEEYLAARAIVDLQDDPIDYIKSRASDPSWREVIRLAITSTTPRIAAQIIRFAVLDDNITSEIKPHNAILTGHCLIELGKGGIRGEDRQVILPTLVSQMKDRDTSIRLRIIIGNLLGRLGDPRFREPYYEPEMTLISEGEFWMGIAPNDEKLLLEKLGYHVQKEKPLHKVYLATYSISKYPITNSQYERFVALAKYDPPVHWKGSACPTNIANHPVTNISWFDALHYCDWLSKVTAKTFRLPTEAEWEKASRGTFQNKYPWGDIFERGLANVWESGTEGTCPVGVFFEGASPYGVEDMIGGVWEWCNSVYKAYPYSSDDGREETQNDLPRILRGGAWDSNEYVARCSARIFRDPNDNDEYSGFRIVQVGS